MTENTNIKLPDTSKLIVSTSPHIHSNHDVRKIMFLVILALLPACVMGVYYFGFPALEVLLVCSFGCVIIEAIAGRFFGRPDAWKDGSALLTGLLLGMILSTGVPWWVCLIGCFIAIVIVKQVFGGLGYNTFNPALAARIALMVGFPKIMTTWFPTRFMSKSDFIFGHDMTSAQIASVKSQHVLPFFHSLINGVTTATPLNEIKLARETNTLSNHLLGSLTNYHQIWNYIIGNMGGCIGETCSIALIAGGIFLIILKIIRWQTPVAYIGTVIVFTTIVHLTEGSPAIPGAIFQVFTGGLIIGAFFMATDMVTAPRTKLGTFISGIGCGIITCVIRIWGGYPEGVMFSIIIMNSLTPHIDKWCSKRPFGFKKLEKGRA